MRQEGKRTLQKLVGLISAFLMFTFVGTLQAHVHGEGQLLIAQENDNWRFEFTLPAADVLGFEHRPEDAQQQQKLNELTQTIETVEKIVTVPDYCKVTKVEHDLANQFANAKGSAHVDVTFTYFMRCDKDLENVILQIFSVAGSLKAVRSQWITSRGQGASKLNKNNTTISFQ